MSGAREKLLQQFRDLVGERLDKIGRQLVVLESGPNPEAGKNALRELHGLKGEARMMGFSDVNRLVHEMEEVVRSTEPRGFALTGGSTDALLVASDGVLVLSGASQAAGAPPEVDKLVDWLKQRAVAERGARGDSTTESRANVKAGPPAGGSEETTGSGIASAALAAAAHAAGPPEGTSTSARPLGRKGEARLEGSTRISQKTLDHLTSSVTSLLQLSRRRERGIAHRLSLARDIAQISRAAEDLGPAAAGLAARLSRAKELAAELHREDKLLANEELRDLTHVASEVQALRMLPLSVLFDQYPRMVRDIARELGKEVELVVEGEDTKADRTVLEALKDPLMHLVRNALDHGLELPEERRRLSKSPKGHLSLRAAREGERILLRVEDDGAGLDAARLRAAAVRRGTLDQASADALTDQAAKDLIFVSGFSSKDSASDLSGRGVGLDVVRTRLQELGGDVAVSSVVGHGATFELRVPVSLTVAPLLFVQAGDEKLCLTASHVVNALKVEGEHLREMAGRPSLKVNDEVLPFASIASILGMAPERGASEGELVLLVRAQGSVAAISVDRVLEERVQAILPLRGILSRFRHLSGATPHADGSLALVLSAAHLISTARGLSPVRLAAMPSRPEKARRRRILVADDSPLTRELLCSLLESVGYEVLGAQDGAEAFDRLSREPVDLLITDLEMPQVDGLELTRRLKAHPTLRNLPVVIVTTRGAEADRRKGMEAGADGYIAKSDLVRQDLVDVVARLLG
ncbi:MAG: response regulator [Myxococcales bacterium]|nr:response regulator [Myxococcales bacterium]